MLVAGAFADAGGGVCAQLLIPAVLSWTSQGGTLSPPEAPVLPESRIPLLRAAATAPGLVQTSPPALCLKA